MGKIPLQIQKLFDSGMIHCFKGDKIIEQPMLLPERGEEIAEMVMYHEGRLDRPARAQDPTSASQSHALGDGPKKRAILVLGMHRSGTSAYARVINFLGAALPVHLLGPGAGNEAGHWEPETLFHYHDKALGELGSSWYDLAPLELSRATPHIRNKLAKDWAALIPQEYGNNPVIVIKEPRICRFTDYFIQCLQNLGYDVSPVFVFRNPLDVIDSLIARSEVWPKSLDWFDAAMLWLVHNLEAEKATRSLKHAVVSYEKLMSDWHEPVQAIENLLGNVSTEKQVDVSNDISEFLDPKLCHHARNQNDVSSDPRTAGWIADCYRALCDLEAGRSVTAAEAVLDRIYNEYHSASAPLKEAQRQKVEAIDDANATKAQLQLQSKQMVAQRIELENFRIAARQHEAAMSALHKSYQNSRSWKLTAPMRNIARKLRKTH